MSTAYWPWWIGALALAGVAVAHAVTLGRPLGVSGRFERALRGSSDRSAHLLFLGGLMLGGLVARLLGGDAATDTGTMGSVHLAGLDDASTRAAVLFVGSVLVGFGTALAGGCTSGHGLVGCARLQTGSLVATAAFFGTAVALSFALVSIVGVAP